MDDNDGCAVFVIVGWLKAIFVMVAIKLDKIIKLLEAM